MKLWEDIINRATLGSAKLPLKSSDLPEVIRREYDVSDSHDSEDDFLRFSVLVFQYRRAGSLPLNSQSIAYTEAESETKSYCSSRASGVLKTILEEDLMPFLKLWIRQCASKELIVTPELIPELLDLAIRKKEFIKLIRDVSGKRGEWLCKINPRWNFRSLSTTDQNIIWETGDSEERKELLCNLRTNNPVEALELLKKTWATEGANEKLTYLEILRNNLSPSDLGWLESLKEKGQRVNAAVLDLIKSIPSSSIVENYCSVLRSAITVKQGKSLLGMATKARLDVSSPSVPETVYKSGIEKLSSDKNVSDDQHILAQLISAVPPSFWNDHLQLPPEAIIELFQKEKKTGFYIPALCIASIKFKDINWVRNILDHGDHTIITSTVVLLINSLSGKDRDGYALKFLKEKPREIIQVMIDQDEEWSIDLTKLIIQYTANEVYSYNRSFYRAAAHLIPVAILDILESFSPAEEQKKVYWKNQSDELARLLTIKQQTLQSFTA